MLPGTAHDDDMPGRMVGGAGPAGDSVRDRGIVAVLQEALLPAALPVLPRARIAARYLVAGQEQAAGGDWFDAIPLADGSVALVVGDVVGHGVAAAAAMGQLRAVLTELLAAEANLGTVLERADAFAARTPALRAATLALAVLDPAGGDAALHHLRASSAAGHRHRQGGQVPRGHRHRTAGHRLAAGPGDQRARPGRAGPAVQRRPRRAAGPDHRRGHGRARRGRRRGGRRSARRTGAGARRGPRRGGTSVPAEPWSC